MAPFDIKPPSANQSKKTSAYHHPNCFFHRLSLLSCLLLLLITGRLSGQVVATDGLIKITAAADSFRSDQPIEKIYLQFDKPYYAIGDTIWFKAYILNAGYLNPAFKTGICYIDLVGADNNTVKREMLPVSNGLSWGNITLDENDIPGGSYTIRAYTRYMCNFGGDYIFKKSFYFFNALPNSKLVNEKASLSKDKDVETAHVNLQFYGLDKEPLVLKNMHLDVLDGARVLSDKTVQTKVDGALEVDLALKLAPRHLALAFSDIGKDAAPEKTIIPLVFNRPENTDVQFMPEGGNLVAGLPAHIGFKAIGEDGKAVEIEGNVVDGKKQLIASFKSTHKGMDAFDMIPHAGENYIANVTLPGGLVKTYPLPGVKSMGTTLKVRAVNNSDSLVVTVNDTQNGNNYYLVGQSRGIVCYAAVVTLANNSAKIKIDDKRFPTGIARFTVLNAEKQALNERIVFINHHDNLRIRLKPDKQDYNNKDSVSLRVHVRDKTGHAAKGSFSIAVTDDAQVKPDSINGNSIISDLFLTSELKGNIEEPGYYFQPDTGGIIKQQLDNLLLTQGWVGYDWKNIFGPARPIVYPAETNFIVKGQVLNIFKKPVTNAEVTLLSRKPSFFLDTLADKNGVFMFRNIIPLDTPAYFIQSRNKNGKSFNVDLKVDEFKPPVFPQTVENIVPWYVNSDTVLMAYAKNKITLKKDLEKSTGAGQLLKEVTINAKKIIKGSQNLNGPGNADIIIDEQELEKAGKKSFLQLLQEKVKGFREGALFIYGSGRASMEARAKLSFVTDGYGTTAEWYFVDDRPLKFIVDGLSIGKIFQVTTFRDLNDYLSTHSAEDIKGIEVMNTANYAAKYIPIEYALTIHPTDITFVEITTRSGGGPNIGFTPGTYLYKPLPFSVPKQFYSPRYTVKNKDTVSDYRSTIYWKPDVVTDAAGDAEVSFFTAGRKGDGSSKKRYYTVIIEGTDGRGSIGSSRIKIEVSGR